MQLQQRALAPPPSAAAARSKCRGHQVPAAAQRAPHTVACSRRAQLACSAQHAHSQQQTRRVNSALGAVAAPVGSGHSTAQSQASRSSCLVRTRVVRNRAGLFRIRHLSEAEDLYPVAQLQAAAFFEPPVLQAFDRLSYTLFKAEVLSAFKKKVQVLADDGFAILVVESCSSATPDTSSSSGSSSSSSSSSSDWHDSDQQHQQQRGAEAGSARAADMSPANRIVGVVEVGVQDERDVLAHLQDPAANLETYAYISSMAVAPHLRRHGVGAALLQTAEAQALAWQQPVLALHVYDSNARAIRLYERHGLLCEARDPAWRSLVGGKVRQLHVKRLRLPC